MKKTVALILSVIIVFALCSCSGKDTQPVHKTADMLDITNTDSDFQGCKSRFYSVLSAMKSKVTVLENAHNGTVKANAEGEYFLENDYISTAFEPFLMQWFYIADEFDSDFSRETAISVFEREKNGAEVVYESDGESVFLLSFISDLTVEEYSVEYDSKGDGFRYIYSVEDSDESSVCEFLEFIKTDDTEYLIQSNTTRCRVRFDDEGNIIEFCCGELKSDEFLIEESLFGNDEQVNENWVLDKGKMNYSNIHTFADGILTHEDCSSGPWKSIKIAQSDYASAFYSGY